ncbi:MAG: hypothetical protein LBS05_08705 [Tannerellaceae bacterium]|jgi:hypothetical protein|nr:hypothetical protein [Tannerellaceae bacterium]
MLPGLGVTHCELTADRNSIIVEPNVSSIKSKQEKFPDALGVYKGVTNKRIADYLLTPSTFRKKVLTTPDNFFTVKEIMEELNINVYEDFFLLIDECDKDFPVERMRDDFFRFRNRSVVSSSPIIASDPLMREHGFKILTIRPDYEYKLPLNLITTNNIVETLSAQLADLTGPVCIFCHSIETIESLLNDIPLLKESGAVFCDEELPSTDKLRRYNMFTSHYYLAVDLEPHEPPHVILISDLFNNKPSFFDPDKDVIQIVGRFRKGVKSVMHISNINTELSFYTPKQARAWLKNAGKIYASWMRKMETAQHEGARELLNEAVQSCSYARFVDKTGNLLPICVAKFIDAETVKGLYSHTKLLQEAYMSAKHFEASHSREVHIFSDKDRLMLSRKLTQEGRNRLLLTRFEQLEVLRKVRSSKAQMRYRHLIDQLINNPSDSFLYNCFLEYGSSFIRDSGFKEEVMRKEIDNQQMISN